MIYDEYIREIEEAPRLLAERAEKFLKENSASFIQVNEIIKKNIYLSLELGEPRYIGQQKYNGDSLQLIDRVIRLNITSFNLIKERKFFEAAILYRGIVEFCAVSIAINKDSKIREKFKENQNFSSTQTIQIAKKHLSEIGRMWGDLSSMIVHTNPSHGTKKYRNYDGEIAMHQYFITSLYRDPESDDKLVLNQLYLMAYLILYTIEIVCFVPIEIDSESHLYYTDKKRKFLGESGELNFKKYHELVYNHPKSH